MKSKGADLPTDKILVADDELSTRQLIAHLLAPIGAEVILVSNGSDALAAAELHAPDVILCDVMMPGMDGFEVCHLLKEGASTKHIPVVLVTALEEEADVARGLEIGADEFVTKPVSGLVLRARVRSMLRIKKQYDGLIKTLALRENLAHMIVHDMRNPVTALTNLADLLLLNNASLPEEATMKVHQILVQAARVNTFLTDLLILAKLEEGRLVLSRSLVDVRRLCQEVVELHQPAAESRNVELMLELPEIESPRLSLDDGLIQRMVDNLLSNAVKFAPRDSVVNIRLSMLAETDDDPNGAGLRLEVLDQGPGIPEEHRQLVFEKYGIVSLHQEGVAQLGLGLAFCKMVVEAHGGRIWVEDSPPPGAHLVVEL